MDLDTNRALTMIPLQRDGTERRRDRRFKDESRRQRRLQIPLGAVLGEEQEPGVVIASYETALADAR